MSDDRTVTQAELDTMLADLTTAVADLNALLEREVLPLKRRIDLLEQTLITYGMTRAKVAVVG